MLGREWIWLWILPRGAGLPVGDLKMFSMLRSKMHWHQSRQRVLAENIANADTNGYRARDLAKFKFDRALKPYKSAGLQTSMTNEGHLQGKAIIRTDQFGSKRVDSFEVTPEGNGVVLEEQMMKVTANQMDYQAVTSLYSKGLGMIRMAARRR